MNITVTYMEGGSVRQDEFKNVVFQANPMGLGVYNELAVGDQKPLVMLYTTPPVKITIERSTSLIELPPGTSLVGNEFKVPA